MAVEVKHATVVVVPDDGVSPVGSDEWNADHQLRLTGPALIGRQAAGQGAAQEITIGSGLSLSGGVLSATGGGGGAPVDATYVTLSTDATLTAERVLTAGAGISLTDGGAGGGGTTSADFAGGAITGAGVVPTIPGGAAGSNPGNSGFMDWARKLFTGGSGGGSSNASVGGRGGDASGFGCGGGGGGAGTTAGGGGNGSDGLVILTVW